MDIQRNIPDEYLCPITKALMVDPVLLFGDGFTYERADIEQWLGRSNLSPMTGQQLNNKQLISNINLKKLINDWNANPIESAEPTLLNDKLDNIDTTNDFVRSINHKIAIDKDLIHIGITAHVQQLAALSLVCVIDVSGSMGMNITLGELDNGFTRLDLVKHGLRTIVHSLSDKDYLSLITFSTDSREVLPLTSMTEPNKALALAEIDKMQPQAATEVWRGLKLGLESASKTATASNTSILLLTDGEPTDSPQSVIVNLQEAINAYKNNFTITTAGFGYNINAQLLYDIATIGNGNYLYIPDLGMVGTIFTNYLANCITTAFGKVSISLYDTNNVEHHNATVSLQYNMTKTITFPLTNGLSHIIIRNHSRGINIPIGNLQNITQDIQYITKSTYRYHYINILKEVLAASRMYNIALAENRLRVLFDMGSQYDEEMKRDIFSEDENEGQLSKAVKSQYYDKWGRHYIPTIIRAHQLQQRNNFKDVGVQQYGEALYNKVLEILNNIYDKLPAPTPSSFTNRSVAVGSMAKLNSADNICFDGRGIVSMFDETDKQITDLCKGDLVKLPDGSPARIRCITMQYVTSPAVVNINNMLITPWHPIRMNGKWMFPNDCGHTFNSDDVKILYNVVLSRGHIITINGIQCCTLGHGFEGPVVEHEFFGTHRIIFELKQLDGWKKGLVIISGVERDATTGLIDNVY